MRAVWPAEPLPLGPSWDGEGTNFSLFSEHAERVELCLFDDEDREERLEVPQRTAHNWHCYLPGVGPGQPENHHGACHRTQGRPLMGLLPRLSPAALRILALLAVLAVVILFFSAQIEGYLNGRLFNRISSSVAIMALIATGQTLVILTRNIDLSIGSVVGFSAFATGSLISNNPDLNPLLLLLYSAAIGTGFGMINGALVAYARVPSIIVPLASMAMVRSALAEYAHATSIPPEPLPARPPLSPPVPLLALGPRGLRPVGFGAGGTHGKVWGGGHRTSDATRNASVRIEVPNADDRLHGGDFVEVFFEAASNGTPGLSASTQLAVPTDAIVQIEGETVVFRRNAKGALEPVTVRAGEVIGDHTVIREGLKPGDEVVVAGAFAVKSQILKAQLGEGHAH